MFIALLFAVAASLHVPGMTREEWSCSTSPDMSLGTPPFTDGVYTIVNQQLLLAPRMETRFRRHYKIITNTERIVIAIYYNDPSIRYEYSIFSLNKKTGAFSELPAVVGEGSSRYQFYGTCNRKDASGRSQAH